ncbi:pilus assembly protein TadG-related protein [Idiomarina sp. HP20-50]|uniref:pilus assembly protein TadG-related protein n=1 Tax=Idiomarina sp. HP20-50 TaxID=3070813 RepID=UPI00294B381F|nr:pilus assembly protein TadG-related protein [Idiomarina sp. HP20-50]MDV6315444.1 pilus assembly protein TadG-related protein [Idiomarina sp. HP20-50]
MTSPNSNLRIKGQTLILMVGVLFLVSLLLFAVTDMGKHARRQWYLQSVADNASYSAAVAMSRQMNFLAITNRALIGNQVAIAQWVGLASYLAMLDKTADNLETVTSFIPYLAQITRALSSVVDRIEEGFDRLVRVLIQFQSAVIQGISAAQRLLDASFAIELPLLIQDIVSKHDENLSWDAYQGGGIAPFPSLWWRKTEARNTENEQESNELEELTLKSLDPFSKSRGYDWINVFTHKIVKRGGTELSRNRNGGWDWHALDSISLHGRHWFFGDFEEQLPLGWGAKAQDKRRSKRAGYGGAFYNNSTSSGLGLVQMDSFKDSTESFTFMRLSNFLNLSMDTVIVKIELGNQAAYAKAKTDFSRPNQVFSRGDERKETDNLFNALWEAELVPIADIDKIGILGRDVL